jgi:hypothetical protein
MNKDNLPIRVVCATRQPRERFLTHTLLGKSISSLIKASPAEVRLYAENSTGLSELYNKAIKECIGNPAILVFAHDDLLLCDFFWTKRIKEGLEKFDIVGLAGNKSRIPKQAGWAFLDTQLTWDQQSNLSGAVGHGTNLPAMGGLPLRPFGPTGIECKILDGLLLAVKSESVIEKNIYFDELFKFHFYDIDFCRQAEVKNLKMGTISLSVVHASVGNFDSDTWKNSYHQYLKKWGD